MSTTEGVDMTAAQPAPEGFDAEEWRFLTRDEGERHLDQADAYLDQEMPDPYSAVVAAVDAIAFRAREVAGIPGAKRVATAGSDLADAGLEEGQADDLMRLLEFRRKMLREGSIPSVEDARALVAEARAVDTGLRALGEQG